MRLLYTLDKQDYDLSLPVLSRRAARGIILGRDGLLMIHSKKYSEYKFPGGGLEAGEEPQMGLAREIREETGRVMIPDSVREYGMVLERRLDKEKTALFEQTSLYYFCRVEEGIFSQHLDAYEEEYGYEAKTLPAREALAHNRQLDPFGLPKWVDRESLVLEMLINEGFA